MRSAKIALLGFLLLGVLLFIGITAQTFRVRDEDFSYYYREKFARRGVLRQAKEKKKSFSFSQQRWGVVRSLWFDEKEGMRRQFHLQAAMALVDLALTPKGVCPKETFLRPHGWLQEKVGWEVASTSEEVEEHNGRFRSVKTKKWISGPEVRDITPFQLLRYYDAMKAIWDIQKNRVTLFQVSFTDYKKQDHTPPLDLAASQILLKGYAEEMTFSFKENGKEEVTSKGLKMHFDQTL